MWQHSKSRIANPNACTQVLGAYFQFAMLAGAGRKRLKLYERAAGVASEAIAGIRTVAAFGREKKIEELYGGECAVFGVHVYTNRKAFLWSFLAFCESVH
jgi:hypothetical protein